MFVFLVVLAVLATAGSANAQTALAEPVEQTASTPVEPVLCPSSRSSSTSPARRSPRPASVPLAADPASWAAERRACDGCPRRSVGRAFLDTTIINVFYELANLARGQVTARITPKTWWANMEQGWVWDLDDFLVNQIGHPYQGNNYFNAGRANGLSFWESAGITAFGSGTWEYFGETNHASLNDLINTTLGGIALGEMFHRTAWLVRDTRATGRGRLWKEIAATAIDPVTGVNRFLSGDSSRVSDKPAEMVPSSAGWPRLGRRALARLEHQRVRLGGEALPRAGSAVWRSDDRSQPDAVRRVRRPAPLRRRRRLQRSEGARPPARTALSRATASS